MLNSEQHPWPTRVAWLEGPPATARSEAPTKFIRRMNVGAVSSASAGVLLCTAPEPSLRCQTGTMQRSTHPGAVTKTTKAKARAAKASEFSLQGFLESNGH